MFTVNYQPSAGAAGGAIGGGDGRSGVDNDNGVSDTVTSGDDIEVAEGEEVEGEEETSSGGTQPAVLPDGTPNPQARKRKR